MRLFLNASVVLMLFFGVLIFPAQAFRKTADNSAMGDAQFKELIRQREIERRESRQRLAEKDQARSEPQNVMVRVHARGDDPTKRDGSKVIATIEMTPEEVRNKDYKRMIAKARAHQKVHLGAEDQAMNETRPPLSERETAAPAGFDLNLIAIGVLGLAALGWWVMRPNQAN